MVAFIGAAAAARLPTRIPCGRRWIFSTSTDIQNYPFLARLANSTKSLGLTQQYCHYPQTLQKIQGLPEVQQALDDKNVSENVHRGLDIFRQMRAGGSEHMACLALLCENSVGRERDEAFAELREHAKDLSVVRLAQSKAAWLKGDLDTTVNCLIHTTETASSRIGTALAQLVRAESMDDAFSIRDPFRKLYMDVNRPAEAAAVCHLNMGVAEAVYAGIVSKHNQNTVPLDHAMRTWKQGLNGLKSKSPVREKSNDEFNKLLKAHLNTNMGWGMLQMAQREDGDHGDDLVSAMEHCEFALQLYNSLKCKEGLVRTLTIFATCATKTGDAVTAQGLFATAIDHSSTRDVLDSVQKREALLRYADLCFKWDKREREAEGLVEQANAIKLPPEWKDKPEVLSSLLYWTPSMG